MDVDLINTTRSMKLLSASPFAQMPLDLFFSHRLQMSYPLHIIKVQLAMYCNVISLKRFSVTTGGLLKGEGRNITSCYICMYKKNKYQLDKDKIDIC